MIRQDPNRIDPKRRSTLNHKKRQFATASYTQQDYPHRLNFYDIPPTAEITLEQFESWAIDRLRSKVPKYYARTSHSNSPTVLAELEACSFRNKTSAETTSHITPLLQRWLPLHSNTPSSSAQHSQALKTERQKDHYSHYILRLAFSCTEDLRRRFARVESSLFRLRFQTDDAREKQSFVESLKLHWDAVPDEERLSLASDLLNATPGLRRQEVEEAGWFKVDFETVPELVESRRVLLKRGKAYVPAREQMSMVLAAFNTNLENGLQVRPIGPVPPKRKTM